MMTKRSLNKPHCRTAFTLIELLIVIAIIGILIGFLVPAVSGALKRARVVSVKAEISQLETAIGKFRSVYNMDPPSSITLYETVAGWAGDANSRALIRQLWPQFNFATPHDINGDADSTDTHTLSQGECLVFFLGGINGNDTLGPTANNNNPGYIGACTGFSKNPADPFARGGAREPFLFEFLPARFTDLNNNGFPEYRDPLPSQTMPYLYYSSYDGQGYRDTVAPFEFDTTASGSAGLAAAYRQGVAATDPRWKANSFQIISPGYDRQYGYGGTYVAAGSPRLPLCAAIGSTPAPTQQQRDYEADNIANFSAGELQP